MVKTDAKDVRLVETAIREGSLPRVRHVGSLSFGVILILTGVACLLSIFGMLPGAEILRYLYPLAFILLGGEILLAMGSKLPYRYDAAAILLMFLTVSVGLGLAMADTAVRLYCLLPK